MAPAMATHLDISQLPSMKEGMTAEEEAMERRKTCRFIGEAARILELPRVAMSTAMVFFHRFYAKHSFQQHDRFEVAVAAIILASKTEESPRKLNTVLMECHKIKSRGKQALDPKGEEFAKLKERILLLERVILHTIGFELSIDHPYKFFVDQIKKLAQTGQLKFQTPPPPPPRSSGSSSTATANANNNKLIEMLVQYSMKFANDSMHTSLCLQFPPQLIATACVYLAAQYAKVEPTGGPEEWCKVLGDPDIESLGSICIQIMDMSGDRKGGDTDTCKKIKAQLELLKSREDGHQQGQASSSNKIPPPEHPSKKQKT